MTTTTLTPSFDEHYVPTRKVATVGRVEITDVSKSYGANQVLRNARQPRTRDFLAKVL